MRASSWQLRRGSSPIPQQTRDARVGRFKLVVKMAAAGSGIFDVATAHGGQRKLDGRRSAGSSSPAVWRTISRKNYDGGHGAPTYSMRFWWRVTTAYAGGAPSALSGQNSTLPAIQSTAAGTYFRRPTAVSFCPFFCLLLSVCSGVRIVRAALSAPGRDLGALSGGIPHRHLQPTTPPPPRLHPHSSGLLRLLPSSALSAVPTNYK